MVVAITNVGSCGGIVKRNDLQNRKLWVKTPPRTLISNSGVVDIFCGFTIIHSLGLILDRWLRLHVCLVVFKKILCTGYILNIIFTKKGRFLVGNLIEVKHLSRSSKLML